MEKLTKKQKKELKKLEEQQKLEKQSKQKKTTTIATIIGVIAFIALAWFLISYAKEQNRIKPSEITAKDVLIGAKNTKAQLVEYADFECPSCATFSPVIDKFLKQDSSKFSFAYRFFPLTSIHKNAQISAQAAYAAHKQNKFMEMYDALYKNQQTWSSLGNVDSTFEGYAKKIGLNINQFNKDYKSKETVRFVKDSEKQALDMGLYSTPTFFLNGSLIEPKDPADLERIIKSKL
jgi:protein-disulfide isomerase